MYNERFSKKIGNVFFEISLNSFEFLILNSLDPHVWSICSPICRSTSVTSFCAVVWLRVCDIVLCARDGKLRSPLLLPLRYFSIENLENSYQNLLFCCDESCFPTISDLISSNFWSKSALSCYESFFSAMNYSIPSNFWWKDAFLWWVMCCLQISHQYSLLLLLSNYLYHVCSHAFHLFCGFSRQASAVLRY
jgi:hypothetical protein